MARSSRSMSSRPSQRYADQLRAQNRSRSPTQSRSGPRSRSKSRSRSSSISRSRSNSPDPAPRSSTITATTTAPPAGPSSHNTINRQLTTPFLLHLCYRSNAFHNLADFPVPFSASASSAHVPAHLQIYTWMSCTLRELAQLLTTALPGILPAPAAGTRLAFRLVYPDASSASKAGGGRLLGGPSDGADFAGRGRYVCREMGSVVVGEPSAASSSSSQDATNGSHGARQQQQHPALDLGGDDALTTLEDVRFVIGDLIDCAIFPPLSDGSVVARSTAMGYGNGVGGRSGGGGGRRDMNGFGGGPPRGGGGGGGGYGRVRAGVGGGGGGADNLPSGEWRRGERLPDRGIGGGGDNYGRPRARY